MSFTLSGKRIAILATNGVDAIELGVVSKKLQEEGGQITLISLTKDPIKTWSNKQWREEVAVEEIIEHVHAVDFDALFLPGGLLNSDKLRTSEQVIQFIKEIYSQNKPIAAICHAPWLLINSGVAKGKKVTSYPSLRLDLENAGATWVDEQVVADEKLITSRVPQDAEAFANQIIVLFQDS